MRNDSRSHSFPGPRVGLSTAGRQAVTLFAYVSRVGRRSPHVLRDAQGNAKTVLTIDSAQEGFVCSEPVQAHVVLTPSPRTEGLLHSNGTSKIEGQPRVIQTTKRFWSVNLAGSVGTFQLPGAIQFPEGNATLEVEDWFMVVK